jgi:chemotaxis protein CheD
VPELAAIPCRAPRLPRRFLAPGGLLVIAGPCEVTTILGPCVAVTFWCRRSHVAAICHAMLPVAPAAGRPAAGTARWKYVSEAIPEMLTRFIRKGGRPPSLEIKLFGGADLLHDSASSPAGQIGPRNVQLVRELLAERGLAAIASDVGGHAGRKLVFNTLTGDVDIKRLPNSAPLLA